MERWVAYLRDLLPGLVSAVDRFNGQVIRYPLVAFYSASAIGLVFALLWARGKWDRWRLRRLLAGLGRRLDLS
jgi:hypothetical protein